MPDPINIGPRAATRRAIGGAIALVSAAGLLAFFVMGDVSALWTLPYAVLLWLGALGVLQARART